MLSYPYQFSCPSEQPACRPSIHSSRCEHGLGVDDSVWRCIRVTSVGLFPQNAEYLAAAVGRRLREVTQARAHARVLSGYRLPWLAVEYPVSRKYPGAPGARRLRRAARTDSEPLQPLHSPGGAGWTECRWPQRRTVGKLFVPPSRPPSSAGRPSPLAALRRNHVAVAPQDRQGDRHTTCGRCLLEYWR